MKNLTPHNAYLMTEVQVAEMLMVSKSTIKSWRGKGINLPYIKLGRTIRYKSSDVERFLNKHIIQAYDAA